ncbi:heat shock protein 70 family, partial [Lactarius pseudohatsudake]
DRRLREIHVETFERKHGVAIREDPKAVMKLWNKADRPNTILSATTEASARVESLLNDIDFSMKVTRQAFEGACADMKVWFVQPIFDALNNSNLTLVSDRPISTQLCYIDGGATWVPMVRAPLAAAVGDYSSRDKIAMDVNSDEAAVLAAALASLSRQFHTKNIKLSDIAPYDVQVSYLA